jgi:hypothetical protein
MIVKELTCMHTTVRLLLQDIRSAVKVQVIRFPGAAPHRILGRLPSESSSGKPQ